MSLEQINSHSMEIVCHRLKQADWLKSYLLGDGVLCQVKWTEKGIARKLLLCHLIDLFELSKSPDAPFSFTLLGDGAEHEPVMDFDRSAYHFWSACIAELALPFEKEPLRAFVSILLSEEIATPESLVSPEA